MPAFANDASDKFSQIISRELLKVDSFFSGKFARLDVRQISHHTVRLSTYSKEVRLQKWVQTLRPDRGEIHLCVDLPVRILRTGIGCEVLRCLAKLSLSRCPFVKFHRTSDPVFSLTNASGDGVREDQSYLRPKLPGVEARPARSGSSSRHSL